MLFNANLKKLIRNNISPEIYQRVSFVKRLILNQDFGFYRYEKVIASNYMKIYDFIYDNDFTFDIKSNTKLVKEKSLEIYKLPPLFPGVRSAHVNTSYIDIYNDNLIYATKNGIFFNTVYSPNSIKFSPLKSNIKEYFITTLREKNASMYYFDPFTISKFGVKDIFIDNDIIYLSYIEEFDSKGYNTSILKAKISDSLVFEKLFTSKDYISSEYREFYPIQSGGRIVNFKSDSLLLSIGEYRDRLKAQDLNSDNGKIIAISKSNGGSRVVSLGHRNPQGLDYNDSFSRIISTEHGPNGGDEVNLNTKPDILNNFGWPISNYGYHYGEENAVNDTHYADNTRLINGSPLHKSHSDYGFIEPIKYWNKNPAVSEVKFINNDEKFSEFVLSTLGYDTINRPDSQHLIHYKYDIELNKLKLIQKYYVGERVRDLIYEENQSKLYFTGESSGVIGILKLN